MSYTPIKSRVLRFNGTSDYIEAADSSSLSFGTGAGGVDTPFTVGLWFVPQQTAAACSLIGKGAAADRGWVFDFDSSGYPRVVLFGAADGSIYLEAVHTTGSMVTYYQGMPVFMGFHYDGTKAFAGITIQVNGKTPTLTNQSYGVYTGLMNDNGSLKIGKHPTVATYGQIDVRQCSIWKNKTSAWLSTLFNSGTIPDCTTLSEYATKCVAYYDINNIQSINDLTSNGNNMSFAGGMTAAYQSPKLDF